MHSPRPTVSVPLFSCPLHVGSFRFGSLFVPVLRAPWQDHKAISSFYLQVALLKAQPEVVSVKKSTTLQLTTTDSYNFLGLDAPGGIWQQLGGNKTAGKGVLVGVIDSGEAGQNNLRAWMHVGS